MTAMPRQTSTYRRQADDAPKPLTASSPCPGTQANGGGPCMRSKFHLEKVMHTENRSESACLSYDARRVTLDCVYFLFRFDGLVWFGYVHGPSPGPIILPRG